VRAGNAARTRTPRHELIVRYLIGDPKHLASRAARIIDGETTLMVTEVVVAETAFVLGSV
jgi:hypothetical protein